MATLLIIASMALNVSLLAIVILLANTFVKSIKTRSQLVLDTKNRLDRLISRFTPVSRGIEGRVAVPFYELPSDFIHIMRSARFKEAYKHLPQPIIADICDAIAHAIKLELEARPQYITIDVSRSIANNLVEIDFSYPFLLYPGANLLRDNFIEVLKGTSPSHFDMPRIISKHF